jgi:hypothetical protein
MSDEELLDFRNEYKKFYQKCTDKLQSVMGLCSDWTKMSEQPANEQIFHLYTYLGLVEGVGNMMANMLILLLVANGHDFHINASGTKHAHTFRELERTNVSIGYKLSFLRYYGIETVTALIDTKLRNDIAHFNFEVVGNNKRALSNCSKIFLMTISL